jgi:hypothetical protein
MVTLPGADTGAEAWIREASVDRREQRVRSLEGFPALDEGFYRSGSEKPFANADDQMIARDVAGFVRIPGFPGRSGGSR